MADAPAGQGPSRITSTPVSTGETSTIVATDSNAPARTTAPQKPFGGSSFWIPIALMFVLMYLILFRGPQKQKQQRKQMMQSLKKNDKVQTIGGIIGTVVDIKDDEITLKVDESNNTKIKVIPSAIGKNLLNE